MKGTNTLHFNGATITEAVQEYLDRRLTKDAGTQVVKSVVYDGNYSVFKVTVEDKTK